MIQTSVEEVAGEQNACDEHKQKTQIKAGPVEFNRQGIGIFVALHGVSELLGNQRRMNCMAAKAPIKNTAGTPRV